MIRFENVQANTINNFIELTHVSPTINMGIIKATFGYDTKISGDYYSI